MTFSVKFRHYEDNVESNDALCELTTSRLAMPFPEPLRVSDGTLLSLKPLEQLSLPSELDGGHGSNRAIGTRSQIAAQNDADAIKAWLARFVDTKATFDTYRKESERLLLWSTTELRKPLSSLTHEDLLVYRRFLENPQPAQRWIMTGRKAVRGTALASQRATSVCDSEYALRVAGQRGLPGRQSPVSLASACA
jgi:hypothetical protein